MTLAPDDLNDLDRRILDFLREDGRASPTYFKRAVDVDQSRQYISSRFVRLAEHDYVEDRFDTGIYDYVADPREADDAE